jgi:hypothetical protein
MNSRLVNVINNDHVRITVAACYERADQENGYNLGNRSYSLYDARCFYSATIKYQKLT